MSLNGEDGDLAAIQSQDQEEEQPGLKVDRPGGPAPPGR